MESKEITLTSAQLRGQLSFYYFFFSVSLCLRGEFSSSSVAQLVPAK
jgi:hypothetical protein